MARSISATNPSAALSLRSRYQRSADFNSARASAWISSGLAAIAESGYLSTRLRPRERLHFAGIQFLDAAGDFAAPLFFGGRVDGIVKAFQQRTGQGGASLGRQRQRLLEKLGDIGCHGRILAPLHTATARSQISTRCHANRESRERRGKPETADCPAGHFSKSVRSGDPQSIDVSVKDNSNYTGEVDVVHPPFAFLRNLGWATRLRASDCSLDAVQVFL